MAGCAMCEHAIRHGAGRTDIPHSDLCRQRIAGELRGTEVGRRRLEEHDRRTNQQIAQQIEQQQEGPQLDAPVAQGEIVRDGRAEASSSVAPPPFSDLPRRSEPTTVIAAGDHLHDRSAREPVPEQLDHDVASIPPEGEPVSYSPTSPGGSGSPGPSILDDHSMADIFDDEESDHRDIVMLYKVEECKAARQQQQQMIQIVAAMGGNARAFVGNELVRLEPSWPSFVSH